MHRFESECPGNDGRCQHGVMWGDRTDLMGKAHTVPQCARCADGHTATCTCN